VISLQWAAPDLEDIEIPRRHRHLTVDERAFVLSGERRLGEYAEQGQAEGDRIVLREGHHLDRKPGSIHGFDGRESMAAPGCVVLVWQSGPGLIKGERGYEQETVPVPFPAADDA
jgi:hypothetical protein